MNADDELERFLRPYYQQGLETIADIRSYIRVFGTRWDQERFHELMGAAAHADED